MELIEKAQISLSKPTVNEDLWCNYGISVMQNLLTANATQVLETEWEERAVGDVLLNYFYDGSKAGRKKSKRKDAG